MRTLAFNELTKSIIEAFFLFFVFFENEGPTLMKNLITVSVLSALNNLHIAFINISNMFLQTFTDSPIEIARRNPSLCNSSRC